MTLDPAWSADGRDIAYVQAPRLSTDGFPQRIVRNWYNDHLIKVYNVAHQTTRVIHGSRGASAPQWSTNSNTLMYIDRDSIWILTPNMNHPVRVATPLYPSGGWPTYYGQVDWIGQFAWSSSTTTNLE